MANNNANNLNPQNLVRPLNQNPNQNLFANINPLQLQQAAARIVQNNQLQQLAAQRLHPQLRLNPNAAAATSTTTTPNNIADAINATATNSAPHILQQRQFIIQQIGHLRNQLILQQSEQEKKKIQNTIVALDARLKQIDMILVSVIQKKDGVVNNNAVAASSLLAAAAAQAAASSSSSSGSISTPANVLNSHQFLSPARVGTNTTGPLVTPGSTPAQLQVPVSQANVSSPMITQSSISSAPPSSTATVPVTTAGINGMTFMNRPPQGMSVDNQNALHAAAKLKLNQKMLSAQQTPQPTQPNGGVGSMNASTLFAIANANQIRSQGPTGAAIPAQIQSMFQNQHPSLLPPQNSPNPGSLPPQAARTLQNIAMEAKARSQLQLNGTQPPDGMVANRFAKSPHQCTRVFSRIPLHGVVSYAEEQPATGTEVNGETTFKPRGANEETGQGATGVAPPPITVQTQDRSKRRLAEMVKEVDPKERLDPEAEKVVLEVADDFVEQVTLFAAKFAKARKSARIEEKDMKLALEHVWNLRVPAFTEEHTQTHSNIQKRKKETQSKHMNLMENLSRAKHEMNLQDTIQKVKKQKVEFDRMMNINGTLVDLKEGRMLNYYPVKAREEVAINS
ncbi:Transcription initiation factor TFIID subunit 12 [Nowakowskiella sp. JEL0407]|nr:Transcription initiation factor TFIID subunit 12 [Nowakowskiella sp. JEL0407]